MGTIRKSFTFIELVVTVGVVAFIVPAIFSISFLIFRQQIILYSFYDIKRQGDNVSQSIKTSLTTNARKIVASDLNNTVDICPVITLPTPTYFPQLFVEDKAGNNYSFSLESNPAPTPNRVASSGATIKYLTNSDVTISNFQFTCYKSNSNSSSIVTAKYVVGKNGQSLNYRLKVKLNTY